VSKPRRLRRLVPDQALFDRRIAGESLRALAPAYGVEHTTLGDFFRRPDGVQGLKEAQRRFAAARRARQAEQRELKKKVTEKASADEAHDLRTAAWRPRAEPRTEYEALLNLHDAPAGPTSQGYSESDLWAESVVAARGGLEQLIDATGLRTAANVLRNIDPQIMRRALANDAKFPSNARPDNRRLRRLVPDSELIRRRAAGEPLRSLATDYKVSHTTLSRYFMRPPVAKQLLRTQRRRDRPRGARKPG
jgi:hypothetical protein